MLLQRVEIQAHRSLYDVTLIPKSFNAAAALSGSASTFSAASSIAGTTPIAAYAWSFGDGSTGTGATPSHVYSRPGSYAVTLTESGSDFCSTTGPFTGHTPIAPRPRGDGQAHDHGRGTAAHHGYSDRPLRRSAADPDDPRAPAVRAGDRDPGGIAEDQEPPPRYQAQVLRAAFYIGRGIKHTKRKRRRVKFHGHTVTKTVTVTYYTANVTAHHLPAVVALSLKGLKAETQTLTVKAAFKQTRTVVIRRHGKRVKVKRTITVTKTLRATFTVC